MSRAKRKFADLDWLMRQPARGIGPSVQVAKWCQIPDLHDREVLALAYRAHGYGQKEIARRIGVHQQTVRKFMLRIGLPTHNHRTKDRLKRESWDRWVFSTIEWAKRSSESKERAEAIKIAKEDFIGPIIPYYWRNIKENRARSAKAMSRRYHSKKHDPIFILPRLMRTRIANALAKGHNLKSGCTRTLLGCNISALRMHLERQFKPGMNWDNRGEWHIDHIRPLASFDLSDFEQQMQAFHFTNLQPLWRRDNLSKSSRWGGVKHWNKRKSKSYCTLPRRGVSSPQAEASRAG